MKRGISPVIATVMLIAIVMVLAVIIFLWARGFVTEKVEKFANPIEYACGGETGIGEKVVELQVGAYSSDDSVEVTNRGDVPIYGFKVKSLGDGEVIVQDISPSGVLLIGDSQSIEVPGGLDSGQELLVVPVILGESGSKKVAYTCGDDSGYAVTVV